MHKSITFALAALLAVSLSSCKKPNQNSNTSSSSQTPPISNARWVARFRSPSSLKVAGMNLANFSYPSISVVDENVIFAAGDMPHPNAPDRRVGVVVRTTDGGETWKEILIEPTGPNIPTINSVCFISKTLGWAVGVDSGRSGVALRTTDGGESWTISRPRFNQIPTVVFFIDEQTGWMGGSTPLETDEDSLGGPSDILSTTDGGRTWLSQRRIPTTITDIFFLDKNMGWAAGYKGVIYHTTDGGRNWDKQRSELELEEGAPDIPELEGLKYIIHSIYFFDPKNGFAAAENEESSAGRALGTINGGEAWAKRWIVNGSGVHGVVMISPSEAWATVGKDRYVYRTVDGGRSWLAEPIDFEQQVTLFRIRAAGASSVWAAGDGAVFKRVE